MMAYGQTAITEDLYAARDTAGGQIIDEADECPAARADVAATVRDLRRRTARASGSTATYVAGCDGFHGVSRASIPASVLQTYEKSYPFGWLGILSETPPLAGPLLLLITSRGFALASMRTPMLSRYYIQCDLDAKLEDWPDERFWQEFKARCPAGDGRAHRHRPVDRKVDRAAAQLRRRADAIRPPVPRRRRRPHRAADRRQGPQPRGLGCLLSVARADRASEAADAATSSAIRTWRCAGCGRPPAYPGG